MLEGEFDQTQEKDITQAIEKTKELQEKLLTFQERIAVKVGKKKIILEEKEEDEKLEKDVQNFIEGRIEKSLLDFDNFKEEFKDYLKNKYEEEERKVSPGLCLLDKEGEKAIHNLVIEKGLRIDGRRFDEIRKIEMQNRPF